MFDDEYKDANDRVKFSEKLLSGVLTKSKNPEEIKHRPLYRPWISVGLIILVAAIFAAIIIVLAKKVFN